MDLYFSIVHWVLVALLVLNVVMLIDWLLGIDKLNPVVFGFLEKYTSAEIMSPFFVLSAVCEFGMIINWITGDELVHAAYISIGALGLGLSVLLVSIMLLGKGLYCIRQYFLNRKNV